MFFRHTSLCRKAEDVLQRMEDLSLRVTNTTEVQEAVDNVKKKLEEMIVFASVIQNQSGQAMVGNKENKEYLYSVNVSTSNFLPITFDPVLSV